MKKFLFGFTLVALLAGSAVVAQTVRTKGLHFVAPTTNGDPSSTVANPDLGEIVFDAVNSVFKGFNGSGWSTLDNAGSAIPAGTILPFVGTVAPAGYVLCDGASYSASTYPNLAQALWDATKYSFGGSGTYPSGSFNVPDLRGKFLRGLDNSAGVDPDSGSRTASNAGGNTGNNVGSIQDDAFQGHKVSTSEKIMADVVNPPNAGATSIASPYGNYMQPFGQLTQSLTSDGTNGTPRISSETRPKNVYVNYIIKL